VLSYENRRAQNAKNALFAQRMAKIPAHFSEELPFAKFR
jgi:hypothetical protein